MVTVFLHTKTKIGKYNVVTEKFVCLLYASRPTLSTEPALGCKSAESVQSLNFWAEIILKKPEVRAPFLRSFQDKKSLERGPVSLITYHC